MYGLGDATLNGRELAVASYLTDHVVPLLIGRDARRIEDTWQYLYKGAYWRRGPVTMAPSRRWTRRCGTSRARRANLPRLPVARRRVPRARARVRACQWRSTSTTAVKAVAHYVDLGYTAIRVQSGIPGVQQHLRRGHGRRRPYEPAEKGGAVRERSGAPRPTGVRARRSSRACATSSAPTSHLLHDVHHRLTPIEAARARQEPRAVPPLLDGGSDAGRAPGGLPPDPAAHGRRRSPSARSSTASSTASS